MVFQKMEIEPGKVVANVAEMIATLTAKQNLVVDKTTMRPFPSDVEDDLE